MSLKKYRYFITFLLAALLLCLVPSVTMAREAQTVIYKEEISQDNKDFVEKVIQLNKKSDSLEDYLAGLRDLGLTEQEVTTYKYAIVEEKNGGKGLQLLQTETLSGEEFTNGEVTIMGGLQSDLTLTFLKSRGDDYGLPLIWIDYYFHWEECEEFNGSDDGWTVNWDTEEAYAAVVGCDSDMDITEDTTGGMGIETDDNNASGHAWAELVPRDGDPYNSHGELTQTYCHTWGPGGPSISFSVAYGAVSVSATPSSSSKYWRESARSTY